MMRKPDKLGTQTTKAQVTRVTGASVYTSTPTHADTPPKQISCMNTGDDHRIVFCLRRTIAAAEKVMASTMPRHAKITPNT